LALKLASSFSQDEDFVFASKTGKPLDYRNVYRYGWEAARDAAGLPTTSCSTSSGTPPPRG
jgi:hypothetical protein